MASGLEGVDHSPFLLSLFHPLLTLVKHNGVRVERDIRLSCTYNRLVLVNLYDAWIESS
jgi:hypothetical protein